MCELTVLIIRQGWSAGGAGERECFSFPKQQHAKMTRCYGAGDLRSGVLVAVLCAKAIKHELHLDPDLFHGLLRPSV